MHDIVLHHAGYASNCADWGTDCVVHVVWEAGHMAAAVIHEPAAAPCF